VFTVPRRAVLGAGVAALGAGALGACSNAGRGNQNTPPPNGQLELPITLERPKIDGTTLSKVEGVPPAYASLPTPGFQSVDKAPGLGDEVTAFSITWGTAPPLNNNQWYEAVNKALNATIKPSIIPAQNFGDKLVTSIASGDIPWITTNEPSYRGRAARKYLPQGVFHDLRELLGGDKVKKYPNLALVPQYAWKNSIISGALYGVPLYRNQTIGGTLCYRKDWLEKGGGTPNPTSLDELMAFYKALKAGGGDKTYPLATIDQSWGFSNQFLNTPNDWLLNSDGTLTKDLETDEYEQSLVFANKLWQAGLIHPDVLTLTPNAAQYQDYFKSGRVGISNGSVDAYYGGTGYFAELAKRNPGATGDVLMPGGSDAWIPPDLGWYCMLSIPSSVTDETKIDEILGIMNYFFAPAGSKEYYLLRYGVEGHNFEFKDGVPVSSTDPNIQSEGGFLGNMASAGIGYFFPGFPDDALACQKWAEKMVAIFKADPTAGLDSATSFSKGDALSAMTQDYTNQIITGRKKIGELDDMRKKWKSGGGDDIRKEYEQAIKDNK